MTAEDREARFTAYALNDPGLSQAERQEIEKALAADPAARRAVAETRRLAQLLTAGLAAEQSAAPAGPVVNIPAPRPAAAKPARWAPYAVAAAVLVAVFAGGFMVRAKWKADREASDRSVAATTPHQRTSSGIGGGFQGGGMQGGFGGQGAQFGGVDFDRSSSFKATEATPEEGATKDAKKGDRGAQTQASPKPDAGIGGGTTRSITPVGADKPVAPPDASAPPGRFGGPAVGGGGMPGKPGLGGPAGPGFPGAPGGVPATPAPPADLSKRLDDSEKAKEYSRSSGGKSDGKRAGEKGAAGGRPVDGREKLQREGRDGPRDFDLPPAKGESPRREDEAERTPPTNDRYAGLIENSFTRVQGIDALSTFGVDVDTASYAIVRKYLSMNQLPPANAVRLEEMVNYFPYADKAPDGDDPFAVTVQMAECPWEPAHRLVRLGLKARPIASDKRPPSNLVFLIDVSGSMNAPNRLPLVKASLKLLVNQLGEKDRIAMVVYAGTTGVVLNSTPANKKEVILNALDSLEAGGSTNGSGGIQQAYEVAVANFIKGGTNRVILCTDGDWNVGTTSTEALVKLIEDKRETGVFLSVFGFGMGNLRDEMMVKLAGKGNGNYAYIDTLREANKAFVEQMGGTLVTVAKDVKVQVEFNPAVIKSYRLLGYEKRALAAKDFNDDKKDAGEMGAGHVVTALYELVPVGAPDPIQGKVDGLRYQKDAEPAPRPEVKKDEAFVVKMRHKKPDGDRSTLRELPVKDVMVGYEKASEDFQFAAAVASFAMLLKDSPYKGQSNYGLVLELAEAARKHDPGEYRAEFIEMVKKAKALAGK